MIEPRVIHPGPAAYYRLGGILLALALFWAAIGVVRGAQTGAWQVVLLLLVVFASWTVVVRSRRIEVADDEITCFYLIKKPVSVKWQEIDRSEVTKWIDGSPFQIVMYGVRQKDPLLKIPLALHRSGDVDYLMGLSVLRFRED